MLTLLHRYLGLILCLTMLVISVTGVLLLWKKEFLWLTIPAARADIDRTLLERAHNNILATYPPDSVRLIRFYSDGLALHKVYLTQKRLAWHTQNGEQLQIWKGNQRIEDWLLDLHHRFLLGNKIGLNVAGFSGLLVLPLMIVGLLIWWPRRRLLRFGLLPKNRQRGVLLRSHGNLGAVTLVPALLLAITGVILVYPTESRSVLLNGSSAAPAVEVQTNTSLSVANVLLAARAHYPNAIVRWIQPQSSAELNIVLGLQSSSSWDPMGRTSVSMNTDGALSMRDETATPMRKRVVDFSYPAHTGQLGLWYRILLSLFGAGLALLSGLGCYSFVLRQKRPVAVR